MSEKNLTELIQAYLDDELSPDDAKALENLINSDPQARRIFMDCLRIGRLDRIALAAEKEGARIKNPNMSIQRRIYRFTAAAAASIAICLGILFSVRQPDVPENRSFASLIPDAQKQILLLANDGARLEIAESSETRTLEELLAGIPQTGNPEIEEWQTLIVPFGKQIDIRLDDNSRVWLNANSELRFPRKFLGDIRTVYLTGEGYFEVSANRQKPFIVHANGADIRVLGTRFNISAYNDRTVTTLVSGKVEVLADDRTFELDPGYQLSYDTANREVERREVNTDLYTSWVTGSFEYEDMMLGELIQCLTNWYGVRFEFETPEIARRRFTGHFKRTQSLDEILHIIGTTTNIGFRIEAEQVRVFQTPKEK